MPVGRPIGRNIARELSGPISWQLWRSHESTTTLSDSSAVCVVRNDRRIFKRNSTWAPYQSLPKMHKFQKCSVDSNPNTVNHPKSIKITNNHTYMQIIANILKVAVILATVSNAR